MGSKGSTQPPDRSLLEFFERAESQEQICSKLGAPPEALQGTAKTSPRRGSSKKKFAGPAFDAELDEVRLTGLQLAIFNLMKDGVFRTHGEIKEAIGRGSENGIAAMLRSLRSKKHGHHTVNKQRRGEPTNGLWEYQLIINPRSKKPVQ